MKPVVKNVQLSISLIHFYSEGPETVKCFIAIALKVCFRTRSWEGPRKQRRLGEEWNTSAYGSLYADDVNLLSGNKYLS